MPNRRIIFALRALVCVVACCLAGACQSGLPGGGASDIPTSGARDEMETLSSIPIGAAQGNGEAANGEGDVAVKIRCEPRTTGSIESIFIQRDPTTGADTGNVTLTLDGEARIVPPFAVTFTHSAQSQRWTTTAFLLDVRTAQPRETDGRYQGAFSVIIDTQRHQGDLLCGIIPD